MGRKKHIKIREVVELRNVFVAPAEMKGKWREFFGGGEIILELACGHGYYTLALAEKFPRQNFIGIDKKGDRIWEGATKSAEVKNAAFVRCLIEKLEDYFEEGEVSEIWITFPDPYPKPSKARKRLTAKRFLEIYQRVLKPGGVLHLKTDNEALFDYSIDSLSDFGAEILKINRDVHEKPTKLLAIRTFYENKFLAEGKKIKYLMARFLA